ncbi:MAG TPA: hypothetical protein VF669_14130 [Tepidisphaeraceae bacterium]|jgi:hypothetical protein
MKVIENENLPTAKKIATPSVRTLVGYTRRVIHLGDGHTLAVFSYSHSAPANWLFLIDGRDLSSRRFAIPNNDIASHSAALGSDGNIYIMPYEHGRAYRFDVARETFTPIDVPGLPPGELTWDALGAPDGCIYFGTYPNACLARYDIATGKTRVWPHVAPKTSYVTGFAADGDGVRCKAWGEDNVWLRINKTAEQPTRIASPFSSTTGPTRKPVFVHPELAEPAWTEKVEGAEITIGHYGKLHRKDASGKVTTSKLDNGSPGGNAVMFIEAVTPTCVIGTNYSQQNLFRLDPTTGKVEEAPDMVARTPGEPMCAVALNGKAYIGIYIHSLLSVYDPEKPFKFQENPRELAELHTQYAQTRPDGATTDGKLVFISNQSDYGKPASGTLAVIDPRGGAGAEKVDAYPELIKGQNLGPLAYDAKSGLVWGGSNRWGQMRATSPTAPSAVIYAFDPAKRKVVCTLTPWEGADVVTVLGSAADGVVAATCNGQVTLVDTVKRTAANPVAWPVPVPTYLRRGADGRAYFASGDRLWRWDVERDEVTAVAVAGGCTMVTEASPGVWVLADSTSAYRVEVK